MRAGLSTKIEDGFAGKRPVMGKFINYSHLEIPATCRDFAAKIWSEFAVSRARNS
jgi:hypothetical protein